MPDPLELLYRADWTRWSFSARVVTRRSRASSAALAQRAGQLCRDRMDAGWWPPGDPAAAEATAGDWRQTADLLLLAPGGRYRFERVSDGRPRQPVAQLVLLVDAELGIVLRQVAYLDGEPAMVFELRDVVVHDRADAAEFDRSVAPGLPLVQSNGGLVADLDLPPALRATAEVGADLVSGAQSALGWLSARLRQ